MNNPIDTQAAPGILNFDRPVPDIFRIHLGGVWEIGQQLPSAGQVQELVSTDPRIRHIVFDSAALEGWDSALIIFLTKIIESGTKAGIAVERTGLPSGVQRLLCLASTVREPGGVTSHATREPFLARIGERTLGGLQASAGVLDFIGEATLAFFRLLGATARFRWADLALTIQECGPGALPIVSLISALVGIIVAFVGIVQLRVFGAEIYIADVVGIAMAREMGALMTAIIMMGRTGAAFAAQLGTMEVNEEIDAFRTLGISPMEFLVMPRILALVLMMPLLCIYSDIVGILGGALIGIGMFDLSITQYYDQTIQALTLTQLSIGIVKSAVFGVLIALSGCYYGMHCGRSASAVGNAATSAVVTGIVLIVVTDGIFAVITNALWI